MGCLEAPETQDGDDNDEPYSDAHDDYGDLDAAIFTAARSLHEKVIHVGLAETVGTRPSTQANDAENMASGPLGIQEAVEKEANFWAKLWGVDKEYDMENIIPTMDTRPGPITAEMIRKACRTFPIKTGLGPDAIQPRALLRLSDEGLDALAVILTAIEYNGDWP